MYFKDVFWLVIDIVAVTTRIIKRIHFKKYTLKQQKGDKNIFLNIRNCFSILCVYSAEW